MPGAQRRTASAPWPLLTVVYCTESVNLIFMKQDRMNPKPGRRRARYEVRIEDAAVVAESVPPGPTTISATEAARSFSDLINRVGYKGERFIIERGGKPMCEISPIDKHRITGHDLLALLASLPRPAGEYLDAVEEVARAQPTVGSSPWES